MKVTTTLTSVETRNGTSPRGPWTLSIFKTSGGQDFSTLDGGLASLASSLIGKPVEIEYEERTNAKGYKNFSLTGVQAVGAGEVAVVTPDAGTYANGSRPEYGADKELRIMRQSALDRALTAFGIAGQDPLESINEVYDLADQFIDYFVNGVKETAEA